jgi:hypothetical protein
MRFIPPLFNEAKEDKCFECLHRDKHFNLQQTVVFKLVRIVNAKEVSESVYAKFVLIGTKINTETNLISDLRPASGLSWRNFGRHAI